MRLINGNTLDDIGLSSQTVLVIRAKRSDIDAFAKGELDLDQFHTNMTTNYAMAVGNVKVFNTTLSFQVAQSFMPSRNILTRVELFIRKNSTTTYPISVSIREELTNDDLTVLDIDSSIVPTESHDWIEINFDDIVVTTNRSYYIVAITENVTDNFYLWGANNLSESYPYGCMWYSIDEGDTWTNKSVSSKPGSYEIYYKKHAQPIFRENITWDMCFKTYGYDNLPPNEPVIFGPICGKPLVEYDFSFNSTDPEGDAVMYIIDWGDNNSEWTEYGDSGEEIILKHNWDVAGKYTIKAKAIDNHNAESGWTEFPITIPRNKAINRPILIILQSHPKLFPLLQKLIYQL